MSPTRHVQLIGAGLAILLLGPTGAAHTATPPALLCKPPLGQKRLATSARHGLIGHMHQYPAVRLASPVERNRARQVLRALVTASKRGNWNNLAAAGRAGYDVRPRARRPGDRTVYFFHAERSQEPRRGSIFDATRPKALIYANAPGRPLVLVGAMWSTRDGELGATPAGPIMRWHSHVVCKAGRKRGLKPLTGGRCPAGARLTQGASEMLHVWFTGDLRSAFAISAPRPELCAGGLIPTGSCRAR